MKNKRFIKIISLMMSVSVLAGVFGGCSKENDTHPLLPEYSIANSVNTFAYNALTDGVNYIDGTKIEYGNFRTVDGYKAYKEAGFNTVMLTDTASYDKNVDWENSETLKAFKNATEAGLEKIVVEDVYFEELLKKEYLVENKTNIPSAIFDETDANDDGVSDELYNAVYNELKVYCYEKGFYGIKLGDKPDYTLFANYGNVYKAVRLCAKQLYSDGVNAGKSDGIVKNGGYLFIHLNVAPIDYGSKSTFYAPYKVDPDLEGEEALYYDSYKDAYTRYIEGIITACGGGYDAESKTGIDFISVGLNLFKGGKTEKPGYAKSLANGFYPFLQTLNEICNSKNVNLTYVCQSFSSYVKDSPEYDLLTEAEMTMELYSALGFGVKNIVYNSYMPDTVFNYSSTKMMNEGCFLNRKGEKNDVYYYGQNLLAQVNALSSVINAYKFNGSKILYGELVEDGINPYIYSSADAFLEDYVKESEMVISYNNEYSFAKLKGVTINNKKHIALVTELKDDVNDLYMYMFQNVIDPRTSGDVTESESTDQQIKADFGTEYTHVAVFENGKLSYKKLDNGVFSTALSAGYAVFAIPLK